MTPNTPDALTTADALLTSRVEITFPVPVALPDDWDRRLADLVNEVCEAYEAQHPDRVMWPASFGSAPQWSKADAAFLGIKPAEEAPESGEPLFDDTTFQIGCCEREAYPEDIAARAKYTQPTAVTPASEEWQPIETAPKDGTTVIVWREISGLGSDCFKPDRKVWWTSRPHDRPTHWLPTKPPHRYSPRPIAPKPESP